MREIGKLGCHLQWNLWAIGISISKLGFVVIIGPLLIGWRKKKT